MLDAAERGHDGSGDRADAARQHRDVARRALEDHKQVFVETAALEPISRRVDEKEVGVVLGREQCGVAARLCCGVSSHAGSHAALG